MKEPKLSDLEIDAKGTRRIRREMAGPRPVKITIHIDAESLDLLRAKSAEVGVQYQRLLNRGLRKALRSDTEIESRVDRLEREVTKLKKKVVA